VRNGGHGNAHCIRVAWQFLEALQNGRFKFFCNCGGALPILVVNANQLHAAEFPVYPRVIPPKFPRTHDGDTDFL
jgi:hypothetical protein